MYIIILYCLIIFFTGYLIGYLSGKKTGWKRGLKEGRGRAPLELKHLSLKSGSCYICGMKSKDDRTTNY